MLPPAEGLASRLFLAPALRTQPDRRLVKLAREGYEAAFEEIVRRYGKSLVRYAASIVGSRGEDVTQDAFSKALLALRRDDAEIELRPWLFRIVRNTALNELRDSPPSPELLADAIAGESNPAEELERREELTDLMRRLQALPESQRAAIVMRELEGLSHDEIAAALGITGGGARQAIHRARKALRDGAGMLIPLPLLQALMAGAGPGTAETAAGAAGAGAAAGAGIGIKATAATVLVAGTVRAGVAIQETRETKGPEDAARAASKPAIESAAAPAASASGGSSGESSGPGGGSEGPGGGGDDSSGEHGANRSGPGSGNDRGREDSSGHSGRRSGHSGENRSGSGDVATEDNSGSGGSGGDSGSEAEEAAEDSSGSGSSGSGSGGSGSGSGDDDSGSSGSDAD